MQESSRYTPSQKGLVFLVFALLLLALYVLQKDAGWQVQPMFIPVTDAVIMSLAMVVAAVALIRNLASPDHRFLYIGIGFLGVALLNGYHIVMDGPLILESFAHGTAEVRYFESQASAVFLAIMLLAGRLVSSDNSMLGQLSHARAAFVFGGAFVLMAALIFLPERLALFAVPLTANLHFDHASQVFAPSFLFLALIAYFSERGWENRCFEFWLVLGLLAGLASKALFLPSSAGLLDAQNAISHLLDVSLFLLCLVGLLVSLVSTYRVAGQAGELQHEVSETRQYRDLYEYTGTGVAVINQDGIFERVNKKMLEIVDTTKEEAEGIPFIDMVAPADRQRVAAIHMARAKGEQAPSNYELRFLTMKGEERVGAIFITSLPDSGQYIVSLIDITEFRRQETELAKLSLAVDQAPVSVVITDLDANIQYVNAAFEKITGYSREEAMGQNPRILQSGETPEEVYAEMWRVLSTGETWSGEFVNRRKDGEHILEAVTISPVRQQNGVITHYLAVKEDITNQRELQHELEKHRDRLEDLVEERTRQLAEAEKKYRTIADFTYEWEVWSPPEGKGQWLYCSPACERVSGFTAQEFLDDPELFFKRIHPEDRELMNHARLRSSYDRDLHEVSFRFRHKDGSERWLQHSCRQVFDENGKPQGRRATNRDITKRVEAHEELLRSRDAAEAAAKAKTEFLANMSHEIRTPLNAILGMTHLIMDACKDDDQQEKLGKIKGAGEHLLSLVSDILELTKLDSGKLRLDFLPFDVGEMMDNVASMVRQTMNEKKLDVSVQCPADLPTLSGDATKIAQTLLNLASNAVKFTDEGTVHLAVIREDETERDVTVRFEVRDEGIGIPLEEQARLFEPFEQLDNSSTRQYGGSGLGLTVSQQLVQAMGGEIRVVSQPGEGSCFFFTLVLPRVEAEEDEGLDVANATVEELREAIRNNFSGRSVLVVEDDMINREVARGLLDTVGLEVRTAEDGSVALDIIGQQAFDLVLMDIQMPVMDGLECSREIRARPELKHMPIVAITANAFAEDREKCMSAGMDDFIPKPVDPRNFYATLIKWLRKR